MPAQGEHYCLSIGYREVIEPEGNDSIDPACHIAIAIGIVAKLHLIGVFRVDARNQIHIVRLATIAPNGAEAESEITIFGHSNPIANNLYGVDAIVKVGIHLLNRDGRLCEDTINPIYPYSLVIGCGVVGTETIIYQCSHLFATKWRALHIDGFERCVVVELHIE